MAAWFADEHNSLSACQAELVDLPTLLEIVSASKRAVEQHAGPEILAQVRTEIEKPAKLTIQRAA